MAESFKVGQLVWARMKGFAPWPARIDDPDTSGSVKKPKKPNGKIYWVFFFGTCNYAWIEEKMIKDYVKFKPELISNKAGVQEAVLAAEDYIKNGYQSTTVEKTAEKEFEELRNEDDSVPILKATAVKPKKERKRKKTTESLVALTPKKKRALEPKGSASSSRTSSPTRILSNGPSSPLTIARSNARRIVESPLIPLIPHNDIQLNMSACKKKDITPSDKIFGFIGMGVMGRGMVLNLLNTGHKVHVWNRTLTTCDQLVEQGAVLEQTPADIIENCDITFCCVLDTEASSKIIYGNCGVHSVIHGKCFVEMTTMDEKTSMEHAETLTTNGGRYLEAQLQGSRTQADCGELLILASGDRGVFDECQSAFDSMSANAFFLGDVGMAPKMNLVLTLISSICVIGMAEGMGLAKAVGLKMEDFVEIFSASPFVYGNNFLPSKSRIIMEGSYAPHKSVALCQKDLQLALEMANRNVMPLHLTATANELVKTAKRSGYGDHDEAAVYLKLRL